MNYNRKNGKQMEFKNKGKINLEKICLKIKGQVNVKTFWQNKITFERNIIANIIFKITNDTFPRIRFKQINLKIDIKIMLKYKTIQKLNLRYI